MKQLFTSFRRSIQMLPAVLYKMVHVTLKSFLMAGESNPIRSYILESEGNTEITNLTQASQFSASLNSLPLCESFIPGAFRKRIIY
jgi:hypothetical protein